LNLLWLGDPKSFDVSLVGGLSLPVTVINEASPLDLRDEITAAISDLLACHSLPDFIAAVRSSAMDEDGATASFAGQHETYLNLTFTSEYHA